MAEGFEATVRASGGAAVIDLTGRIDGGADADLAKAYEEATDGGRPLVVLNFSDVGYINSTGIALVVGLLAKARASGTTLRAFGLSDHYHEIFQITRLADFVGVFPDEVSATA